MDKENLKEKTIKGVGWSIIDNLAGSGITFLVGIVLARILSTAEFGVIGILMIFISISNSIVDSGFSNALIRKIDASDRDYNTVFIINMIMGLMMYLILFVTAPHIAEFFRIPIITPTLRVLSIVLLINALSFIQHARLIKQLDFRTLALISAISSICSAVVGIGMALSGYGVWALVGQQFARQLTNTILLWFFNRWCPNLFFSGQSFHELFNFGFKLLIAGLIDTIYKNVYQFVIGKFYSKESLGNYTRALQFEMIFSSNLTAVIQKVSYPTLSKIQDDAEKLKTAYRKLIILSTAITFTCLFGLIAVAKPLVFVLIGVKWEAAIPYLQLLCFSGILYPLHALNLNILKVKGRSDVFLRLEVVKKIIASVPVLIGIYQGIIAMLVSSIVVGWISYFLNAHYSGKYINYSFRKQFRDITPSLFISSMMALLIWSVMFFLPISNLTLLLIIQILLGVVLTVLCYKFFYNQVYQEFIGIIKYLTRYISSSKSKKKNNDN